MVGPAADLRGELCRQIDELLFTQRSWFCIDAGNRAVTGARPPLLQQCLDLIGRGEVASVVGTLRPEVVGIDVDAAYGADIIVDTLRDWCSASQRRLAHLVRPSGGAPGRAHVLIVPGRHRQDLTELFAALRRELGPRGKPLGARDIDLRTQLRPLSAPHRSKPTPALDVEVLTAALEDLRTVLQPLPHRIAARRAAQPPAPRARSGPDGPLVPLARRQRPLAAGWAAYLRSGRTAAVAAGLDRDPSTRSELELRATRELVLAGYGEEQAWQAIASAHPTAFTKARANGRRWWWNVWNAAVRGADDWLTTCRGHLAQQRITGGSDASGDQPGQRARGEVQQALERAHAAMLQRWLSWPERMRHSAREVYSVALGRLARVGATATPIPLRDLVLDCAVGSLTTVRQVRDFLIAEGLLEVRSTYVTGTTDTADTWGLPSALTTPTSPDTTDSATEGATEDRGCPEREGGSLSRTDTSRGSPPQPALTLRRSLKLPRTHLLTALQSAPTPLPSAVLAHQAGLLPPTAPGTPVDTTPVLTQRQRRTVRQYLQDLAELGFATVDEHGHWRAAPVEQQRGEPDAVVLARTEVLQAGHERHQAVRAAVEAERADFRARMDPVRRRQRWNAEREHVLRRQAQRDLVRQRAWWAALPPDQREQRRCQAEAAFTALSPGEQAHRKHAIAQRRTRAGGHERERYLSWWNGMSEQQRNTCRSQRTLLWRSHDPQTQHQLVTAWSEHRARWGLPHRPRGVVDLSGADAPALLSRDLVLDLTRTGQRIDEQLGEQAAAAPALQHS